MALVDYAVSSDDDDAASEAKEEPTAPKRQDSPPIRPQSHQKSEESSSSEIAPEPLQLPDASLLLNDHDSKKKRDSNGLSSSLPRSKVPRGNLPHTRNAPDTGGGMLVPPQLSGRKNIVTEDVGKLFVRRHTGDSSH